MTKVVTLVNLADFKCPFCGAPCAAQGKPDPLVIHALPLCRGFVDVDAVRFLEAANRAARLRN